jgi:hypothetical protein
LGGDLLGLGSPTTDVLRGDAEISRLDDLAPEIGRWDHRTGDGLSCAGVTGSSDLRTGLGLRKPQCPVFYRGSAVRVRLFPDSRASREGERQEQQQPCRPMFPVEPDPYAGQFASKRAGHVYRLYTRRPALVPY